MKTPLGTEVDLGAGHIVLDAVPAPSKGRPPSFWPMSNVATVTHLRLSATAELLLTYIFAVLLPDLSRLSCHSVQRMFLKMNRRHHVHKPVKKCNYWGPIFQTEWSRGSNCVSVPNFEAIAPTEIWRYFAILDFKFLKFLTVGRLKRAELCRHAEFGRNRPKRGRDMAIF